MAGVVPGLLHIYLLLSGSMLGWATNEGSLNYQYPQQFQPETTLNPYYGTDNYVKYGESIDRQAFSFLQRGEVHAIQIGTLVILGGAAIVTWITAVNNQRDFNALKGRFQSVCNAVRAAGAIDGSEEEVVEPPVVEPPVVEPPVTDPVAQEALRKVDKVISALSNVADSTCDF